MLDCDLPRTLERGQARSQLFQFPFAQPLGAACQDARSALDEYPVKRRIGCRGGDVAEGSQQPKADGHVHFRVHPDLLKGCV